MTERSWPSRFGTLGERIFGKDDPFNDGGNLCSKYIHDEMEPTKNPLNPKEIYTSKAKLREAYRAAGAVEVGDAYDRGYVAPKETPRSEEQFMKGFRDNLRGRINNG